MLKKNQKVFKSVKLGNNKTLFNKNNLYFILLTENKKN